jgi:phage baseplate assembly protein W
MAAATAYQISTAGATWIDVNTDVTQNTLPDRLPDTLAITRCSLINLFNCPIGSRGRIFQPTYGSMWYQFLQEPIDDITAGNMRIAMIQAISKWEPRITLDYSNTSITPDLTIPGYVVKISGTDSTSGDVVSMQFTQDLSS